MFLESLATAPADEFWWICGIAIVVALAGGVASFMFLRHARLIEDTPTSRVRSAAQGYVELEGQTREMEGLPIVCPLSGTRCVWWRYRVEEKRTTYRKGKSHTRWVTVSRAVSDDSFLLDDGTGQCIVDPTGARIIPTRRRRWYGNRSQPDIGPEAGSGLLRSMFCRYRYTEELIFRSDLIYALGHYRTQSGGGAEFDEKADLTVLLNKWKRDPQMMELLDVNKDGHIDAREWEAARRMALNRVREEHVRRAVETPDLNILSKPKDGRPYLLSGVPQAKLVRRYRTYAGLAIAGFFASGTFVLLALNARGIIL
jgi:hypothetical protein